MLNSAKDTVYMILWNLLGIGILYAVITYPRFEPYTTPLMAIGMFNIPLVLLADLSLLIEWLTKIKMLVLLNLPVILLCSIVYGRSDLIPIIEKDLIIIPPVLLFDLYLLINRFTKGKLKESIKWFFRS